MRFLLAKLSVYRSGRQATRGHEASELTVHLRWHSAVETIALNVIRHLSGSKLHTRSPHSQGGWLAISTFFAFDFDSETRDAGRGNGVPSKKSFVDAQHAARGH